MSTAIEQELNEQLKASMRAGDKIATMAIRMVRTRITERRTAKNATEVKDDDVLDIIRAYTKQLQGAIDELVGGGAGEDEANIVQMRAEIAYLQRFLPRLLDEQETAAVVARVLAEHGITDPKMAGKATGLVMKDYKGKADPGLVSRLVREKLGA